MGVEFGHLLIPRDNTWHPQPGQVARLMARLKEQGLWGEDSEVQRIARPGEIPDGPISQWFEPDAEHDWVVSFPVDAEAPPKQFPFAWPGKASEPDWYVEMQLLRCAELVEPITGEHLDPLDTTCECGTDLRIPVWDDDIFYADRIRRTCPRCRREFRPQDREAVYRSPFTGEPSPLRGGVCFRFAIRIQAGKGLNPLPRIDGRLPRATPAFLALCEQALGQPLYEVGYLY